MPTGPRTPGRIRLGDLLAHVGCLDICETPDAGLRALERLFERGRRPGCLQAQLDIRRGIAHNAFVGRTVRPLAGELGRPGSAYRTPAIKRSRGFFVVVTSMSWKSRRRERVRLCATASRPNRFLKNRCVCGDGCRERTAPSVPKASSHFGDGGQQRFSAITRRRGGAADYASRKRLRRGSAQARRRSYRQSAHRTFHEQSY